MEKNRKILQKPAKKSQKSADSGKYQAKTATKTKKTTKNPPADAFSGFWRIPGELVALPVPDRPHPRWIDGFHRPYPGADALLVFVHGMGSDFYRSPLKKAFLQYARLSRLSILSVNNRGAGRGTEDEPFRACLPDLDAVLAFARASGYRTTVFLGHSTGCQKIAFWHSVRHAPDVAGLVLLAPADDNAILRRDLGRRFDAKVAWARAAVAAGRGDRRFTPGYETFTAARFLSLADPRRDEAAMFRYAGPLTRFRRIASPVLAVFGEDEEFAPLPPAEMLAILRRRTRSRDFDDWLVPGAGHSFAGCEPELARAVCAWARETADAH